MSRQKLTKDDEEKIPKTVSLSVPKGYEKEVAYLGKQPNKSRYVWDLVKEDMERQSLDNQIIEIVRQAMQNVTVGSNVNNSSEKTKVNNLGESIKKKGALSILQD